MKTLLLIAAISLVLISCSDKKKTEQSENRTVQSDTTLSKTTWYAGETPFIFNEKENYPETAIRLNELADASYIPLGTNDSVLLELRGTCNGNDYFMTNDLIFMQENQKEIYVFKTDGTPVSKIARQGGGPEEYRYISCYAVDTLLNEIFIQDQHNKRTNVYDFQGHFKRAFPNLAKEIVILNDSLLVNFFLYNPGGPRYSVIRKTDGSQVKACPIRFNTKLPEDSWGRLAYGSLIHSPNGVFLSNMGNDTIFEIHKNQEIIPRIIDKSDYGTTFAQVHPSIETERYLMFYVLCSPFYKPHVKQRFYIYDKKEKQIYKMIDYPDNTYWTLMDNYPHIQNWETTQIHNVAIRSRLVTSLFEADGKHGDDQLKEIIKNLDEDANPVLQVMTFHSVDTIKK